MKTKKSVTEEIILNYEHDYAAEGSKISKRRLWYILKPLFKKANLKGIKGKGKPVTPITNADFNKYYNDLAKAGEIDDTYIEDSSRTLMIGSRLPHIIIATEKDTITGTATTLANNFGISLYVMGGFSSIYASKKLSKNFTKDPIILILSDYDKPGFDIQNTAENHFPDSEIHRILLNPDQVPEDRKDDDFSYSDELGKWYELDILNLKELQEVFLDNVPNHIAEIIKDSYELMQYDEIKDQEIENAIFENEEYKELLNRLNKIRSELYSEYESTFIEANPINFIQYNIADIHYENVKYTIKKWRQ